jgi:hypothetical protein
MKSVNNSLAFNRLAHAMGMVALQSERKVRNAQLRAAMVMLLLAHIRRKMRGP